MALLANYLCGYFSGKLFPFWMKTWLPTCTKCSDILISIYIKQQATSVISPLFAILHFIASKCFKDPPLMVIRVTESPRLALNPYQSLILSLQWLNLAAIPYVPFCSFLEQEAMRNFGVGVKVMPMMKVGPQRYLLKSFPWFSFDTWPVCQWGSFLAARSWSAHQGLFLQRHPSVCPAVHPWQIMLQKCGNFTFRRALLFLAKSIGRIHLRKVITLYPQPWLSICETETWHNIKLVLRIFLLSEFVLDTRAGA